MKPRNLFALAGLFLGGFLGANLATGATEANACTLTACSVVEVKCLNGTTDVVLYSQRHLACGKTDRPSVSTEQRRIEKAEKPIIKTTPPRVKAASVVSVTETSSKQPQISANWRNPVPSQACYPGIPTEENKAFQIVGTLTYTCDPVKGGWNIKVLGNSDPLWADGCVLRGPSQRKEITYTFKCKRDVRGISISGDTVLVKASQTDGRGQLKMRFYQLTAKGKGWSIKQVK